MYESDKSKDSLFFDENNLKIVGLDTNTKDNIFVLSDGKNLNKMKNLLKNVTKQKIF